MATILARFLHWDTSMHIHNKILFRMLFLSGLLCCVAPRLKALDRTLPDRLLQQIENARAEMSDIAFRTHPAQLRNLEIRARLVQKQIAENPDSLDEASLETALGILRSEWIKSSKSLAEAPLRHGDPVPSSAIDAMAPIELMATWTIAPEDPLAAVVALKLRAREGFQELPWQVRWQVPAPWIVDDPSAAEGHFPLLPDGETSDFSLTLRCPPTFLEQNRVVEAAVVLGFSRDNASEQTIWTRRLSRRIGDAGVALWHVWLSPPRRETTDTPTPLRDLVSVRNGAAEDRLPDGVEHQEIRAPQPARLQSDPFFVAVDMPTEGEELCAAAFFSSNRPISDAVLHLYATQRMETWLDGKRLAALEWKPVPESTPPLFQARTTVDLLPTRHRLDLTAIRTGRTASRTMFAAEWRNASGEPLRLRADAASGKDDPGSTLQANRTDGL